MQRTMVLAKPFTSFIRMWFTIGKNDNSSEAALVVPIQFEDSLRKFANGRVSLRSKDAALPRTAQRTGQCSGIPARFHCQGRLLAFL